MGRPPTGRLDVDPLADGTRVFRLRFHADGRRERRTLHERRDCTCGCGGGWSEGTARVELDNELAGGRAGVWPRPGRTSARGPAGAAGLPSFHEYASWWLQAKVDGVSGHKPIDANTR